MGEAATNGPLWIDTPFFKDGIAFAKEAGFLTAGRAGLQRRHPGHRESGEDRRMSLDASGTLTVARALSATGSGDVRPQCLPCLRGRPYHGDPRCGAPPSADRLALPALVNAHDHGLGLSNLAVGAGDDPLEIWRVGLYARPSLDVYANAAVAFGRQALSGIGTIVHLHVGRRARRGHARPGTRGMRAARDVGVRLVFVYPLHDRNC